MAPLIELAAAGAFWLYVAALAVLAVFGVHRLYLIALARWRPFASSPLPASAGGGAGRGEEPVVTVQLPLFNEPAVARRLIDAVAALDWPADRLEIQILDDSTDATSAICAEATAYWRARGLDVVHLRRRDRGGFKAGALEAGRKVARGELLLILDADFVAPPDLLRRTVPRFADPLVGMVQARWGHLNRESSRLTETQAVLLDGHFGVEQAGRAGHGRVFNFNGTAGVWRAVAIAAAGGWHADTLTEDLDLSYRAAMAGWRFVYDDDLIVNAELPATMDAFRTQQFRWAKGSAECLRKLAVPVWRSRLPLAVRLDGLFHLGHNLPYLATAVMVVAGSAALLLDGASPSLIGLHVVTAALTTVVVTAYAALGGRESIGRALVRIPATVLLTLGISLRQARAVLEGLVGRVSPFVRTPKDGLVGAQRTRRRSLGWRFSMEPVAAVALVAGAMLLATRGQWMGAASLAVYSAGLGWVGFETASSRLGFRESKNAPGSAPGR